MQELIVLESVRKLIEKLSKFNHDRVHQNPNITFFNTNYVFESFLWSLKQTCLVTFSFWTVIYVSNVYSNFSQKTSVCTYFYVNFKITTLSIKLCWILGNIDFISMAKLLHHSSTISDIIKNILIMQVP